jgi:UDP-2-acetamido-2-deoxy-ribo-hexuluronate aminotransferase
LNPTIEMVDLRGQYQQIKTEIDRNIQQIITTGAFVGGAAVNDFAANLAQYLQVKQVIPCANGTDALQIALMALDLQPGDEVISTSFTFIATTEVIALLGLKPVFVDIDPLTYTLDVEQIEAAITPRTKCIIPVHLYGQCADMQAIMKIAQQHNLYVVEDNAQAIGADYIFNNGNTQKAGTIGHIGCTSFYPSKNLGCYGDGGALFTNDPTLAEKISTIANHGQREKYTSHLVGVNSRLDGIQAAVLNTKLKRLDQYIQARQQAAQYYDQALSNIPQLTLPQRATYSTHVFHQYTLRCNGIDRNLLRLQLQAAGIPTMVYYPIPSHQQPAYKQYSTQTLPHTEAAAKAVISLPMHTELNNEQLYYITTQVKQAISNIIQ